MKVLMVGVSPERTGGMWTVAENYINNKDFCKETNLIYISTSTNGSAIKRLIHMLNGFWKICFILQKQKIDIIHVHMAEKGSVFRKGFVLLIAKKYDCKTIIHMHAGPFKAWYNTKSIKIKNIISKIFSLADRVVVLGSYWKTEMSEIIPVEKIQVLYNGIAVPNENPYNEDAKNVIFMGRMNKLKGIYDLLKAVKNIEEILPPQVHIQLCGADEIGDVSEEIQKLGLNERIEWLGWINNERKKEIYKNTMLNILPSYYEGLSMTVLEAMANGIPTITTNISTMPELIPDERCLINPGDIVALGNKIYNLSLNTEIRLNLSTRQFERARCFFSIEVNINTLLELYNNLYQEKIRNNF